LRPTANKHTPLGAKVSGIGLTAIGSLDHDDVSVG